MKKVYKYGTEETIPEGATYLCTKVQTSARHSELGVIDNLWLVWHYFLVEVKPAEEKLTSPKPA